MSSERPKTLIISDFNVGNFAGYLRNDPDSPPVEVIEAPYGQVVPVLVDKGLTCWRDNPDFAVVWTQPEAVVESFRPALDRPMSIDEVLEEVDRYASMLMGIRDRVRAVLVPTWVVPYYNRGLGMLDLKETGGLANVLMRMNVRLSERLAGVPGVYLLDAQRWIASEGKGAFNPKLWYLAKVPFGNQVFVEAVGDIKSALRGLMGHAKKAIILDLDDTLWGGVVGDLGWENVRLGGHDHIGEAYADFQAALKALASRGIVLTVVSKNEEDVALQAIQQNPEMVLQLDDFVGWRINWQDKAQNIVDLMQELNLGLNSAVFIDDNPAERERVRLALPDVYVPEWPQDPLTYRQSLLSLRCFDSPNISEEDAQRTLYYVTERNRETLKKEVGSVEEWLASLDIRVKVEELSQGNLQRATQLFNKTNQMNLSTRRMSDMELLEWASHGDRKFWTIRVGDKLGDAGLVGLISVEVEDDRQARVADFVLSCRVFGRKIEETAISTVVRYARSLGVEKVVADYLPTKRNKVCLEFLSNSGLHREDNGRFSWDVADDYPTPAFIQVEGGPTQAPLPTLSHGRSCHED